MRATPKQISSVLPLALTTFLLLSGCVAADVNSEVDQVAQDSTASAPEGETAEQAVVQQEPILPKMSPVFDEQWPTEFTLRDMDETVLQMAHDFFDESATESCPLSITVDFQNPHPQEERVISASEAYLKHFCNYLTEDIWVVVSDYEYLRNFLAENGLRTDDHGGLCGPEELPDSMTACALWNVVWAKPHEGDSMVDVTVHELFHVVQDAVNPDPPSWSRPPDHPQRVPNWVTEGCAVVFQGAFPQYIGDNDHHNAPLLNLNKRSPLRWLEENWSYDTYAVGSLACEYMIANSDFESMINLWAAMGEGLSFDESFELNFGMSFDDFYPKFKEVRFTDYDSLLSD